MNLPGWKRTRAGTLRLTLKGPGVTVALFEKRPGGPIHREVWDGALRRWHRRSLGTADRREAERLGRELLARLLADEPPLAVRSPLALLELWDRYRLSPSFIDNAATTRADTKARVRYLLAHFGEWCDVRTLSPDDMRGYVTRRRSGGLALHDGKVTRPVREKSAAADVAILLTMLRWAVTVRTADGSRWLADNPLAGCKRPSVGNPRRPVATWDRFLATLGALYRLTERAETPRRRRLLEMTRMVLVLAEATGRRRGSILALSWADVDLGNAPSIRWRAEADKLRREWLVPITSELAEALKQYRRASGAVGGLLFPGWSDSTKPADPWSLGKLLTEAEREAGLPKLDGSLWHAYRRKWATERKTHPLKDVMHAGGWRHPSCLLTCYQQADTDSLRLVMAEPRKLREGASAG